jgi:hypothetical protein
VAAPVELVFHVQKVLTENVLSQGMADVVIVEVQVELV